MELQHLESAISEQVGDDALVACRLLEVVAGLRGVEMVVCAEELGHEVAFLTGDEGGVGDLLGVSVLSRLSVFSGRRLTGAARGAALTAAARAMRMNFMVFDLEGSCWGFVVMKEEGFSWQRSFLLVDGKD